MQRHYRCVVGAHLHIGHAGILSGGMLRHAWPGLHLEILGIPSGPLVQGIT